MKVLHDMDLPREAPYLAFKRGLKLILYSFFMCLGIRFSFIDSIYEEFRENADLIIKLDRLVGIEPVIGIKTEVQHIYPNIMTELRKQCMDVREHIHVGDKKNRPFGWGQFSDPNRTRLWVPPLDQSKETWSYDTRYVAGEKMLLKEGQLPIWHIHRSDWVKHYINFLYSVLIEGERIYEES